jgi:hypothetical protein
MRLLTMRYLMPAAISTTCTWGLVPCWLFLFSSFIAAWLCVFSHKRVDFNANFSKTHERSTSISHFLRNTILMCKSACLDLHQLFLSMLLYIVAMRESGIHWSRNVTFHKVHTSRRNNQWCPFTLYFDDCILPPILSVSLSPIIIESRNHETGKSM